MQKSEQSKSNFHAIRNKFENFGQVNKVDFIDFEERKGLSIQQQSANLKSFNSQMGESLKQKNIKRTPAFRIERSINCQKNNFNSSKFNEKIIHMFAVENDSNSSYSKDFVNGKSNFRPQEIQLKDTFAFSQICHRLNEKYESNDLKQNNPIVNGEFANLKENFSDVYTEPIPKALRQKYKVEKHSDSKDLINYELFSKMLKMALEKPLPDGPAPKKPPRTFEYHRTDSDFADTNFQKKLTFVDDDLNSKFKDEDKRTDPRYMLTKLENALKNNRIRSKKHQEKFKPVLDNNENTSSLKNMSKDGIITCSHKDNTKTGDAFNFSCLSLIRCSDCEYEQINPGSSEFSVAPYGSVQSVL